MTEESATPDLAERVERMVEAFNAGNFDLTASFYAPDALFYPRAAVGVLEGRDAIRSFFEDWRSMYEEFTWEVKEFCDLSNGVTFSVISQRGRLADTVAWVPEERSALVVTWADGPIEKETNFTDPSEARATAERLVQERG